MRGNLRGSSRATTALPTAPRKVPRLHPGRQREQGGGSLARPAPPRPIGRAIDGGGATWLMPLAATGERICPWPAIAESWLGDVSWRGFAGREMAAGDIGGPVP